MAYVLTQQQVDEIVDEIVSLKQQSVPRGYCPYALYGNGQHCGDMDCSEHQAEFWEDYREGWYKYFENNKQQ